MKRCPGSLVSESFLQPHPWGPVHTVASVNRYTHYDIILQRVQELTVVHVCI